MPHTLEERVLMLLELIYRRGNQHVQGEILAEILNAPVEDVERACEELGRQGRLNKLRPNIRDN